MSRTPARVNSIRSMDDDAVSRAYSKQMARFQTGYDRTAERAHAACPEARHVLDAATGPALSLPRLATLNAGATFTGLDISQHMLDRARETVELAGMSRRVRLVRASVYEMPFEDGSFDLVLASQVIHMLDDLPRFCAECCRVLRPGGVLVIADFRRDAPAWYRAVAQLSTGVLHALRVPMDGMGPVMAAAYTPAELEAALRRSGFAEPTVRAGLAELTAEARCTV